MDVGHTNGSSAKLCLAISDTVSEWSMPIQLDNKCLPFGLFISFANL